MKTAPMSASVLIPSACVTLFRRLPQNTGRFEVLLIKRGLPPKAGFWAFPGGKHDPHVDRSLVDTAVREMYEETGLRVVVNPNCYYKHVAGGKYELNHFWAERLAAGEEKKQAIASTDAVDIAWMNVDEIIERRGRSNENENHFAYVEDLFDVLERARAMVNSSELRLT